MDAPRLELPNNSTDQGAADADSAQHGGIPPGARQRHLRAQLNGVTRTLERLTSAVRDRGGDVRVYTTSDPEAVVADDVRRIPSVPFWAYPQLRLAAPSSGWLRADWSEWQPSLVHAATPFGVGIAARRTALELSIPLVTSYHTSFAEYAKFYALGGLSAIGWSYLRWFHNGAARTYCPTRAVARALHARGFNNAAIWGRGVDTTRFAPDFRSRALRESLGVSDSCLLVAYVGRVAREKGIDTLLEAMHNVDARPDLRLLIVGDGPYHAECRARAPEGTIFTGRVEGRDLAALYASSDLFVFPSATDTFGNVLLEAQASGVSIIAAESEPSRELLGASGARFYPASDAGALATSIVALARDPGGRSLMARAGLGAARERSWDCVFDSLFADYSAVIEAQSSLARAAGGS